MSLPDRLGEILPTGRVSGKGRKKLKLEVLKANWVNVAGEEAAEHSIPTRLAKGVLRVAADDSSWASELSMRSADISRKAESLLGEGEIERVRVLSKGFSSKVEERAGEQPGKVEGETILEPSMSRAVERIRDEGLRSSLSRLILASKGGKKTKQK